MSLPPFLLSTALAWSGTGVEDDAKEVLARLQESLHAAEVWTGVFELEHSEGTRRSVSWTRFWVDVAETRCRADIGSIEGPVAQRSVVADAHRVEEHDRRRGELAREEAVQPFSLGHCLASCGLADPLLLLFTGRLAEDATSYGEPRVEGVVDFEGRSATAIVFPGNQECRVWIDREARTLLALEHETIEGRCTKVRLRSLEPADRASASARFELDPKLPRGDWTQTHRRWQQRLKSSELWPAPGSPAPRFEATDDEGQPRTVDTPQHRTLLCFDFARDPEFVEQHARALGLRIAKEPELDVVVVLHPTSDAAADRRAFARFRGLREERLVVVMSGSESVDSGFSRYRVYHCPTYFLLEDGKVVAANRRLDSDGDGDGRVR